MIKDKDRSKWFGASDTRYIMGKWVSNSFFNWWQEKLGINSLNISNIYTTAGSVKEHQIANSLGLDLILDRQVRLPKYRLRVNLDAETKDSIYEIKTFKYSEKEYVLPKSYWQQLQVQMYATGKRKWGIVAYGMLEEDYENFFLPIDTKRLLKIEIAYDEKWIKNEYLPRLKYLAKCLKLKSSPNVEEFEKEKQYGKF